MKISIALISLSSLLLMNSCSTSPSDAAVNAATSNMGPAQSTAVRQTTGHGTGPVEKAGKNTSDKIENLTR